MSDKTNNDRLEFLRTYEIDEFKAIMNTPKITVFQNKMGKSYVRFFKDGTHEMTFPASAVNSIQDIMGDPVISEAYDKIDKKTLFFLHKRSDAGHLKIGDL